jgi:hypothetical protein
MHIAHKALIDHTRKHDAMLAYIMMRDLRIERDKGKRDWSAEIFVPRSLAYRCCMPKSGIINALVHKSEFASIEDSAIFWRNYLFSSWRLTLGIYRFDPTVYPALIDTPIDGDMPSTVLTRLPEWSVYVEAPRLTHLSDDKVSLYLSDEQQIVENIIGFWAMIDIDDKGVKWLYIYPCPEDSSYAEPVSLMIKNGLSLRQSIVESLQQSTSLVDLVMVNLQRNAIERFVLQCLSLLLWLCSDEPDISNVKDEPINKIHMPVPKSTKKGFVFDVPSSPKYYNLASRIGGEIRAASTVYEAGARENKKRPHIRRAHWHGYWKGKVGEKTFDLKWLPPVFVSGGR